jgi:hypothetical protein
MNKTEIVARMAAELLIHSWSPIRWKYDMSYATAAKNALTLYYAVELEILSSTPN